MIRGEYNARMQTMNIQSRATSIRPQIEAIRHKLHENPELGYEEHETCRIVAAELTSIGVEHRAGMAGGTGILAHIPATVADAPTIALRADMDALPIEELTGLGYASKTPGRMHACGHDGHTSILLGAAHLIQDAADRPNNVTFIFQPAEEGGAGADRMCHEGALGGADEGGLGQPVDMTFGLHGWPELELGRIATRVGPLLAATDEFNVTIRGAGGHAAYPHLCTDPIVIAAEIITAVQTIASRATNPLDSVVVTVGSVTAGETHNVIPDEARIIGTIRTLKDETRAFAEARFRSIVEGIAAAHGATVDIHWHEGYPVTRNDPGATKRLRSIASTVIESANVLDREHPTMGGEDFSYYGRRVPACFFFLGLRPADMATYPNLHTPQFDFNDDALPVGMSLMAALALEPLDVG